MEKASRVMYSIANFFTWVLVIISIVGMVLGILMLVNVIPNESGLGNLAYIIYLGIVLIVAFITIAMVRRAKAQGSSKGWDVLFIVLGAIGGNIFYILGGIFGLIAPRR